MTLQDKLVLGLLLWSLGSLGSATVGLYAKPGERWRAFWFMSGIWGLIDGLIACGALWGGPSPIEDLLPILRINAGLDVLYVVIGAGLVGRSQPMLRGFGLGVIVQGAFLLAFDSFYWWRCAAILGQTAA